MSTYEEGYRRGFLDGFRAAQELLANTPVDDVEEDVFIQAAEWLRRHDGTASVRELLTYKVGGVRTSAEARELIALLVDRGLAERSTVIAGGHEQMRVTLRQED